MSKVAVITGASGGIGAAVARRLAAQGSYVVLGYCRSREKAESLCRELREAGGEAVSFRADLTKAEEAKALIDFAVQQYGHLDILVNNAGISQIKLFTDITPEEWRQMFAANVDGIYHCCRAAVPYLVQQHSGTIINVSSIWGLCGASCEVHYSASKAAVIGFTQALAKELAPSGITVNCVAPGAIDTEMNAHLTAQKSPQRERTRGDSFWGDCVSNHLKMLQCLHNRILFFLRTLRSPCFPQRSHPTRLC